MGTRMGIQLEEEEVSNAEDFETLEDDARVVPAMEEEDGLYNPFACGEEDEYAIW